MILRARGVLPISQPPIADGAVAVSADRIQAVGPWKDLRRHRYGDVIDLGDMVLLPGLVNAHCHLDYTDMAGLLTRPKAFPDWIKEIIVHKAGWSYSDFAASWLHGTQMLLRSGVTTVLDIEAVPELLPDLWGATPLRVISCLELINIKNWRAGERIVRETETRLAEWSNRRGGVGLSPHAVYSTSPDLLRLAVEVGGRRGWPVVTHVAESREEFEMFTERHGPLFNWLAPQRDTSDCGLGSPVQHLARHGALGPNLVAVHVNYLADGDARLLAQHGTSVAHCPRSHAYFRHQPFPFGQLAAEGVNVALGTDSLASVVRERRAAMQLDLFSEMRTLAANERGLSPETILRMATLHGARAVGKSGRIGELCPGACADLIAIPISGRHADLHEAVLQHRGDVAASMIGGEWAIAPAAHR